MALVGQLNTKVKFEENTNTTRTSSGAFGETYVEFLETWGKLRKITGDRNFQGMQAQLVGKWELEVRHRAALDNKTWKSMRVVALNRFFAVESIDRLPEQGTEFMRFILKDISDK